ncbi:hypothetical protein DICPUDRAFT_156564 [Dictyostelium purpureum]|uniref:Ubiquitin-like modifier-activating enzyme ATG7 n=1 Tax=Dictyostelium purpureum TaxID=5786 RepID=F0ZWW8_DICPU|nr:uncharacterized protein DICPUDRAFT_156564 [Dictyostelium purpureum]EGC31572.1 hypothetical protein DICPUDRAFT_156564 [Dictyostelium purpureum]|eukprot:XP_003291914.1 hypothetical protein DICPUDRAFT_156564 [Dictyostelium purpureum]
MSTNNILQYKEFSSFVNISFWHELSSKKLDVLKLNDEPIPLNSHYTFSPSQQLDPFLCLEFNGFQQTLKQSQQHKSHASNNNNENYYNVPNRSYLVPGTLLNYNTAEDFKQSPKTKLFEDASKKIWSDIVLGFVDKDMTLLNRFILITYADIKNHQFYYLFGIPALLPPQPIQQFEETKSLLQFYNKDQIKSTFMNNPVPQYFYLVGGSENEPFEIKNFEDSLTANEEYFKAHDGSREDNIPTVGFCDPCSLPSNPGWPLRNFLIYLIVKYQIKRVRVVCFRGVSLSSSEIETNSIVLSLTLPEIDGNITPEWSGKSVGWEKDNNGKIAPRFISLASTMDPLKLASQSVDLNLKLMRWRVMPSLNLEAIKDTKCLLLGSGTLGCNVARCLMSWGVRNITFVDSSKVSYSNPVRQSLFTFDDCTPKNKEKSVAAAEALKKIFPAVNAKAEVFSIPMPGHSVPKHEHDNVKATFEKLEQLIKEHDVVYLLTDSRESRWLPTLLCRANNKLLINAALGFDSYLVIRHGIRNALSQKESDDGCDLGCYFCNDVIAPTDTLKDRTLDQMCTVTRPGLSMIASSIAVELLISTLHHPLGGRAPAETDTDVYKQASTPLGIVPHQLRGFLSHYQTLPLFSNPYKNCTACSDFIVNEFNQNGFNFILNVMNDSSILTKVAGIDELKNSEVTIDWDLDDILSDDE